MTRHRERTATQARSLRRRALKAPAAAHATRGVPGAGRRRRRPGRGRRIVALHRLPLLPGDRARLRSFASTSSTRSSGPSSETRGRCRPFSRWATGSAAAILGYAPAHVPALKWQRILHHDFWTAFRGPGFGAPARLLSPGHDASGDSPRARDVPVAARHARAVSPAASPRRPAGGPPATSGRRSGVLRPTRSGRTIESTERDARFSLFDPRTQELRASS